MGRRLGEAGFTLIELMVVISILGLLLALVPNALSVAIPGQRLRAAAYQLADDLRNARAQAVMTGEATAVPIRLDAGTQRVGASGARVPRDTTIQIQGASIGSIPTEAEAISFFPDGSASGGTISLGAGGRTYRITIDWLTGRITVDE